MLPIKNHRELKTQLVANDTAMQLAVILPPQSVRVLPQELEFLANHWPCALCVWGPEASDPIPRGLPSRVDVIVIAAEWSTEPMQILAEIRRAHPDAAVIRQLAPVEALDQAAIWLRAGVDDCIRQGVGKAEWIERIHAQMRHKRVRESLVKANQDLKELASTDDLTGLLNMRTLYQKLEFELDRSKRYNRALSCLMIDLDHFKGVNDQHDHIFGSFVLKKLAELLRDNIRSVDLAARYGGDEFLLILTETPIDGAKLFAERLRQKIAAEDFRSGAHCRRITVSIGVAAISAQTLSAEEFIRQADLALYEAKQRGRNQVRP